MKQSILNNIDFTIKNLQENVFRVKRNERNEIVYTFNEGPIPRAYNLCTNNVYGKTLQELFGEENANKTLPYFEEAFTGKVTSYQLNVNDFIFQTVLSPIEIAGEVVEVSGTSFDITEDVKKDEELKRAYEKLKELNDSKNKLFSIIAHDLRGPIGNLINLLEIAIEDVNHNSSDQLLKILTVCMKAANNSYALLEELFEWAKNEIEEVVLNPKVFNINDLLIKNIDLYHLHAESKSIIIQFDNHVPISVFADENTINTVIRNLISNAIKFSFEKSIIKLEIKVEGNECLILIKDNGVGISKEKLGSIFDFGEEKSTHGTKGEKGTGLGLALSAELVKKNGGKINVKSEMNNGSTFYFSLPFSSTL
ncbi:MAG: HAMP domain-containing histidine kinase [Candidatus Delongbacteria bacterium]|nr:HAMP domain-containing histidine kinase [Candidatus Delongbacteria bacterium]